MKPRQPARRARCQAGRVKRPDDVERDNLKEASLPATHLSCTRCGTELPLEGVGTCPRCFGPLEPAYDPDELRRSFTRERIEAGSPSLWRYAPLLPVETPADAQLAPGLTPLVPAARLAAELGLDDLYLKLDTANPTHSFKDRVVAVACAKAQELGLDTLACSSTGNLANAVAARAAAEGLDAVVFCPFDLEREKLVATAAYGATIYAVRGSYDDCSRLTVELSFELPWGFVNVGLRSYYAEASKTIAYEIAEQLGWELPDVVACPIASGSLFSKVDQGFRDLRGLGLVGGPAPRLVGAQAAGCAPVASAFAEERPVKPIRPNTIARSLAIGSPADGERAIAAVRASGGAIHTVAEDEIGENMGLLAETTGVFGEAAAGVTLGALREAIRRGKVRSGDRVVLLVTGDGLKTPGPVTDRFAPVEIPADADALLAELGITV
jgi:threonine synthase